MPLLTSMLILIVLARLLGKIFERYNQPAIVGEMLAGVLLGPSVLNLIQPNAALSGIAEFAVFLVVLSAGLEMNLKDILFTLRGRGIVIALLGFLLPFAGGVSLAILFEMDVMRTVFLGLCVSITALPVAVRILQNFNLLNTDIARHAVATAIFNDVVALLVLGIVLNLPEQPSFQAVAVSIARTSWKLLLLGAFILSFNWFLQKMIRRGIRLERFSEKIVDFLGTEAMFGILVLFVLVFGSVSEALGFHFVIGAFFGALLIERNFFLAARYDELNHTLSSITGGFLAPVFFAYLGLEFNIAVLKSTTFITLLLAISVGSKIVAGWLGGWLIRLPTVHSLGIGIILNGRGVMELVIASIAYERGFIGQGLFSTLVFMGVVTTMITPLMFRKWVIPRLHAS